jgi:HEPN domain-containing protein
MHNTELAKDYVIRSEKRLSALKALFKEEAWADVVRESQEVVELALKGLLRSCNVEVPRIHDVSEILIKEESQIPKSIKPEISKLAKISKSLRRDRELAFYGSEDLTPKDFYSKEDAKLAMDQAHFVVATVKPEVLK